MNIKLVMFILFIIITPGVIFYLAHKDEPKLKAECEARGGMLVRTNSPLYSCVGKPPGASNK